MVGNGSITSSINYQLFGIPKRFLINAVDGNHSKLCNCLNKLSIVINVVKDTSVNDRFFIDSKKNNVKFEKKYNRYNNEITYIGIQVFENK